LYSEEGSLGEIKALNFAGISFLQSISRPKNFSFFSNGLYKPFIQCEETKAESIVRIFDKINSHKEIKIFVAMPYYSEQKLLIQQTI